MCTYLKVYLSLANHAPTLACMSMCVNYYDYVLNSMLQLKCYGTES